MGIQSHNQKNMITKPNIDQGLFSMIKIVLTKLASVGWNVDKLENSSIKNIILIKIGKL